MIDQPFTCPTLTNNALKDMTELYRMSLDEQIECAVMMLVKHGYQSIRYQVCCFCSIYGNEYFVAPEDEEGHNPTAQLPLSAFRLIYERVEFNTVESNSGYDLYKTRPLPLVDVCDFLYGLTRRGAIDAILENL